MITMAFEHYNCKVLETLTKLYYVNSTGKVGQVYKCQLRANDNQMNESLIQWITPKTMIRNGKPIAFVTIAQHRKPIKKIVARCFLRQYNPTIHYIYHKDNDYQNCNVLNLALQLKHEVHADIAYHHNRKPLIISINDHEYEYDSIKEAAKQLYIHPDTLSNFMMGKTKSICIDHLEIITKGNESPCR